MKDTVVFYHGLCPDGFGAAFAAWLILGETAEYVACQYGMVPPDVTGKRVYILDFSFEVPVMVRLDQQARELHMLDHHKTARDSLHGFKCRCGGILFDLNRSGARLAWEHFHPNTPIPALINFIQDRDLWTWELPDTADYLAALDALGYDFLKWLEVLTFTSEQRQAFIERGRAMNEKFQSLCDSIAEHAMPITLLGHQGLMVNASSEFSSDVGARMAKRSGTFGLIWKLEKPTVIKISLRSVPDFDASAIAIQFGGGGHPASCSFRIPLARLPELISGTLTP